MFILISVFIITDTFAMFLNDKRKKELRKKSKHRSTLSFRKCPTPSEIILSGFKPGLLGQNAVALPLVTPPVST